MIFEFWFQVNFFENGHSLLFPFLKQKIVNKSHFVTLTQVSLFNELKEKLVISIPEINIQTPLGLPSSYVMGSCIDHREIIQMLFVFILRLCLEQPTLVIRI